MKGDLTFDERAQEISSALAEVQARINKACEKVERDRADIHLIAVTKTYPTTDVLILQGLGVKEFGENRDVEGVEKSSAVDGHWHFQGQVQSNKISSIARWAHTVHSLDEISHLQKFDRALDVIGDKTLKVFIQVSLDADPSRAGVQESDLLRTCQAVVDSSNLQLMGVMTVPPVSADPDHCFSTIAQLSAKVRGHFPEAKYLSAGMSGDFEVAITYGATHIRIGSQILGPRSLAP